MKIGILDENSWGIFRVAKLNTLKSAIRSLGGKTNTAPANAARCKLQDTPAGVINGGGKRPSHGSLSTYNGEWKLVGKWECLGEEKSFSTAARATVLRGDN